MIFLPGRSLITIDAFFLPRQVGHNENSYSGSHHVSSKPQGTNFLPLSVAVPKQPLPTLWALLSIKGTLPNIYDLRVSARVQEEEL